MMRGFRVAWLRVVVVGLVGMVAVRAEAARLRVVSVGEFRGEVVQMQGLVARCAANQAECEAAKVVADERVGEIDSEGNGGKGGFEVHWGWLTTAVGKAKEGKPEERARLMKAAAGRLEEMARESGAGSGDEAAERHARAEADGILARPEFQIVQGTTWWDRLKARFYGWLGRIFSGVARLGTAMPWLGRVLEGLLFLGAAVGVVLFVMRSFARQRMRIALGEGAARATAWDREGTDWAKLAEGFAAEGAWRDAVHCLYWAAIVTLEGRRAWRHNPTRTPREYVRLLQPGSAQQAGLRGLTQIFERVWYGLREGEAEEYRAARALYDGLAAGAGGASADAGEVAA